MRWSMTMPDERRPVVLPTEVRPKATRRSFSAEFKRRVLVEADKCTKPGEVGARLRREGLYSSHLTEWRAVRQRGWERRSDRPRRGDEILFPFDVAAGLGRGGTATSSAWP
jgi:transposase